MTDTILAFNHIGKQYFGVPVLQAISMDLKQGHILGLVGENGAGKSTLMNIMGGVVPADEGYMTLYGQRYSPQTPSDAYVHGIAFIHQELNLFSNLSVAENIFIHDFPTKNCLGLTWINHKEIQSRAKSLLETVNLDISPNTLIEDLSTGERQLVEIAKALSLEARIIIFDEPTTSLSSQEKEKLFDLIESLRDKGISMIYISHALDDVMRLCDDVVVLRDGKLVKQGAKDSFTTQTIISAMVGRDLDQIFPERSITFEEDVLLRVESLSYPEIIHNINFQLYRGEILGIAGLMGSGRTELAKILFGLDPYTQGRITLQGEEITSQSIRNRIRQGLSFLTEDRRQEGLLMDASIQENIVLASLPLFSTASIGILSRQKIEHESNYIANTIQLNYQSLATQAVKTLSGGNQQKTVLAKWLLRKPSVLILDEPTRGIDVGAKFEIYKTMNEITSNGGGILFISSEIEELLGMCDRIMVMRNGEIRRVYRRDEFDQEMILRSALGEDSA